MGIGCMLLISCAAISFNRAAYFKDDATFIAHWLETDPGSPQAHASYGELLGDQGRAKEAMAQYRAALRLDPAFLSARINLANGLLAERSLDEAMEHISVHGTGHSDGILTRDDENASRFIAVVDSAAVYVNASTRYTDGSQFGLGAEVAISTQRLHARGPMALQELTIYKYVVLGDYHVRP